MKTLEEIFKEQNPQDGTIPKWAKKVAIAYAKEALGKMGSEIADYYLENGISTESYIALQSKTLSIINNLK